MWQEQERKQQSQTAERFAHAVRLNASNRFSQALIRFQLAPVWSTNLRSPAFVSELRLASQPSLR
jgi:hypothetical protein